MMRLDLGGGGAAGLRKRRTSKSPVTAPSPKAVKAPQARNLDALLAHLPAEPASHEEADPPQLLRQYLEMRANGLDDVGTQAAIAMDRDLSEAELLDFLRLELSAAEAAGQVGLEPLVKLWTVAARRRAG